MSGVSVTFWGAAGQVTGSCHLLEWRGHRVALDCGLFQGKRDASAKLNANLPFDARATRRRGAEPRPHRPLRQASPARGQPVRPADLRDASHARSVRLHADRFGSHPGMDFRWLQKKGRAGPSSAPLYNMADAIRVQELMENHPYDRPFSSGRRPHRHLSRCGAHSRQRECRRADRWGAAASPGLLRRYRTVGTTDHPRPRLAQGPHRYADHREYLRPQESRPDQRRHRPILANWFGGAAARRQDHSGARHLPWDAPRSWSTPCTNSLMSGRSRTSRSTSIRPWRSRPPRLPDASGTV